MKTLKIKSNKLNSSENIKILKTFVKGSFRFKEEIQLNKDNFSNLDLFKEGYSIYLIVQLKKRYKIYLKYGCCMRIKLVDLSKKEYEKI